jgi:phosphoribosylaminoimidazole carboxylase PurE protein
MDVLILCGSASDLETMAAATKTLKEFGVSYALHVASAHRTPDRVRELVATAEGEGLKVIIAAAGLAAHLAGAVAGQTTVPVIGVPLAAGAVNGLDALLSTVQMPPGVPVATVAIGKPGAVNSAVLAVEILALADDRLKQALRAWRRDRARAVTESDPAERG